MMNRIQMNGIKLSRQLLQVSQRYDGEALAPIPLYGLFAAERINITFVNISSIDRAKYIACCIESENQLRLKHVIAPAAGECGYQADVGALSAYPHKFSLRSLGYLLSIFGREQFPLYQLASSNALLTFVTDYAQQEAIAACLERQIDLPPSRTPFRQELDEDVKRLLKKMPETSAAYSETKIKTYGIRVLSGLLLCQLDIPARRLADCGEAIQELENRGFGFSFTSGYRQSDQGLRIFLLTNNPGASPEDQRQLATSILAGINPDYLEIRSAVSLINLQGPHFGDRHGIADQAFSALAGRSIPLLAASCAGAMVSMALPEKSIEHAKSALAEVFESP